MTDSPIPIRPPSDPLDFEPVPRQVKRPNGWTPERQRRFIALLAETGSPQRAAEAMNKRLSGIEAVYRDRAAASFRVAWHAALEIAAKRERDELAGIREQPRLDPPHRSGSGAGPDAALDPDDGEGGEDSRMVLIERLIAKFQRKVGQEREARLSGQIVAADFYLRQITALEVAFDLMIDGHGDSGWQMLAQARRGALNMLQIADTTMARVLDQARRDQWAAMDEPERPLPWPERYCLGTSGGDVRTEPTEALGKSSRAAPGVDPDAWRAMDTGEQQRIYDEQHAADAKAQVEWERRAHEAWEASEHGAAKPGARKEHGAAKPGAAKPGVRGGRGAKKPKESRQREAPPAPANDPYAELDELDDNGEDFADRAMREAIAAARKAHPEDWE